MTDRYATVPAQARGFQGQRAGIVTRVAASVVDFLLVILAICLIYGGIALATFVIRPSRFHWPDNISWSVPVVYFVLVTAYLAFSWAGTGRTYGAALLGVRVVNHNGAMMRLPSAILRALLCVVFPIGLLWVAISSRNCSVQDLIFRTAVIYDWSPRADVESPGEKARALPGL
jgi:uncharacterized RDD family membrane protein YckC